MSSAASGSRTDDSPVPVARLPRVTSRSRRPRRRELSRWGPFVVVATLAALLMGLHVGAYRPLAVSEPSSVDYVNRLLEGEVPAAGDAWAPGTTEAVACRTVDRTDRAEGTDRDDRVRARCGESVDPDSLPGQGRNTSFVQTPLYYLAPAGAVGISEVIAPALDDVDAMRATGALWLVAALGLMWQLWRSLDVPWQTRAGLSLALVATPTVLLAQSTVTTAATALASGAAVVLATLRWDARRAGIWLPVATGVLALLLEATNLAVVLAGGTFVLFRARQRTAGEPPPRDRWVRALAFVGALAAATAVVRIGWSTVSATRADPGADVVQQPGAMPVDGFDPGWLTKSMQALVTPLQPESYQSILAETAVPVIVANLADVGLLVAAVIAGVVSRPASVERALAVGVGVAALAFGPLLSVLTYLSTDTAIQIPARYGLSLVPGMLAVVGSALRGRRAGWAVLAVGGLCYVAMAWKVLL